MINKVTFKNYKSFKDRQELEIRPLTVLIGKNSSGKSAIAKLMLLIQSSLSGDHESVVKWNGYESGIELGADFSDLLYGRSKVGKLELEITNGDRVLEVVISTEREQPKMFSWKLNGEEKLGFDNSFKGFRIDTLQPELDLDDFKFEIDYIGPFRQTPPRELSDIDPNSASSKVGYDGGGAYSILLKDGLKTVHPILDNISKWYKNNFEGWGVQLNREKDPFHQLELFRNTTSITVNLKDVGQGISQALPLIVKAILEDRNEELIPIEQPELHLHPAAHGNLAELFVQSTENGRKYYLIETHSQNFVLRLRRLIAEKKYKWFNEDMLALYYVDFDEISNVSTVRRIKVDSFGKVDYWPETIFSETLIETMALRDAQNNSEDAD